MPCWTTTQTQIELGLKTDAGLIHKALAALDLNPQPYANGTRLTFIGGTYDTQAGRLTLTGRNPIPLETNIKRAYGSEIAKREAARYGWTLKAVPGNQFKFEVQKR